MGYIVYCHTNKVNNKKYVGITSQKALARWQGGKHYNRHARFYADILAFGWDNFTHEVLYKDLTKEQAEKIERELIKSLDLTNIEKGYNTFKGGSVNTVISEDVKAKLSKRNSGSNNPFYNHKHSKETRIKMSENRPKVAVYCVDTQTTYKSTREAERLTGAYHSDIIKCCKGLIKKAGGLSWQYKEASL